MNATAQDFGAVKLPDHAGGRAGDGLAAQVATGQAEATLPAWKFQGRDGQLYACSWCQAEQHITPSAADGSHGICPRHARAELQAIE